MREALVTSGKAVTFTAVTMVISTVFWTSSSIRFNAEMGLLLAIWMAISYVGSQTLTPVLIVLFRPKFIMKEANRAPALTSMSARARGEVIMVLNMWNSIAIVLGFSFLVVFLDEYIVKPWRQKKWEREAASGDKRAAGTAEDGPVRQGERGMKT